MGNTSTKSEKFIGGFIPAHNELGLDKNGNYVLPESGKSCEKCDKKLYDSGPSGGLLPGSLLESKLSKGPLLHR